MMPARETGSMIAKEPHYEIAAAELAAWIEDQGPDLWWTADGEPILRLFFPCPGDELAAELRRVNRPLLILDKHRDPAAQGQLITRERLNDLANRRGDDWRIIDPKPIWADDRVFALCWKGKDMDWFLMEDTRAALDSRQDLLEATGEESHAPLD